MGYSLLMFLKMIKYKMFPMKTEHTGSNVVSDGCPSVKIEPLYHCFIYQKLLLSRYPTYLNKKL